MTCQLAGETGLLRAGDLGFPVGRRHEAIHVEPGRRARRNRLDACRGSASEASHVGRMRIAGRHESQRARRKMPARRPAEPLHPEPAGSTARHHAEPDIHGASLWADFNLRG